MCRYSLLKNLLTGSTDDEDDDFMGSNNTPPTPKNNNSNSNLSTGGSNNDSDVCNMLQNVAGLKSMLSENNNRADLVESTSENNNILLKVQFLETSQICLSMNSLKHSPVIKSTNPPPAEHFIYPPTNSPTHHTGPSEVFQRR